jgi:hypothetical protein
MDASLDWTERLLMGRFTHGKATGRLPLRTGGVETAVVVPIEQWRRATSQEQVTLKE